MLQEMKQSFTALQRALFADDLQSFKILLELGADPNSIDEQGQTIFLLTIRKKNLQATEMLLKFGADINKLNAFQYSTLYHVAYFKDPNLLEWLCKRGASISLEADQLSPFYAVSLSQSIECLAILLKFFGSKGIDHLGNTALHYAAGYGWLEGVQICIQTHPDCINRNNKKKETPVILAIRNGHEEVFNFLVSKHCKIDTHIYELAVCSTPSILRSLFSLKEWRQTIDDDLNSPQHLLIKNYPFETDKNNFLEKFQMICRRGPHWLLPNQQGQTAYELALNIVEEQSILEEIIEIIQSYAGGNNSIVLIKPLEHRQAFPCQAIIPRAFQAAFNALLKQCPILLKKINRMNLDKDFIHKIERAIRKMDEMGKVDPFILDLVIVAQKSDENFLLNYLKNTSSPQTSIPTGIAA
jgi:ankyrin repeat protein